jgi:hypothetical protein
MSLKKIACASMNSLVAPVAASWLMSAVWRGHHSQLFLLILSFSAMSVHIRWDILEDERNSLIAFASIAYDSSDNTSERAASFAGGRFFPTSVKKNAVICVDIIIKSFL